MSVSNALNHVSSAEYCLKYGKPLLTTDINGNEIRYRYDQLGRLSTVTAPCELDNNISSTIWFEYNPHNYNVRDIANQSCDSASCSWARTLHFDIQDTTNNISTTVLSDGLGRVVQTRKDAEVDGTEVSVVSGCIIYDCFGRTVRQYYPFVDTSLTATCFKSSPDQSPALVAEYDIMDRQTKVTQPYSVVTTTAYDFGTENGKTYFSSTHTDALGNSVVVLSGTRGQTVRQTAPLNTVTRFEYDALGQLLKSVDPDGFQTMYSYDMSGRLVQRIHPDAGTDHYAYDAMGNPTIHINALGDSVKYHYYYHQLKDVTYSRYPANNVHYTYGTASDTSINAVGKVIFQEDATGWQSFKYGKLGEVTENIRTFAFPFEDGSYTFKMNFKYYSYNRIQSISYPDGEVVKYCYDHGGMLKKIYGVVKRPVTEVLREEESEGGDRLVPVPDPTPVPVDSVEFDYSYVDSVLYNVHGLRDSVIYGNGTRTGYGYDSLLRLSSLRSYDASGNMMQNLVYDFDKAGNILTINNSALPLANGLGGAYFDRFTYDSLYRLRTADGQWHGASPVDYSLQMSYTHNGRISNKILSCSTYVNGVLGQDSYARRYRYDNSNRVIDITPVASSQALFKFQWDNTGNLLQMTNSHENISRQHIWTEENRLQEVLDKKWLSFYVYDSGGERVFKTVAVGDVQIVNGEERVFYSLKNATLYASPYLIVTPKGYTKHYYAESERVASQVGSSRFDGLRNGLVSSARVASKQTQLENMIHGHQAISSHQGTFFGYLDTLTVCLGDTAECYWFHFDHLGSSSWVTDSVGHAVQHLHYLPWGEDFVNQRTTNFSARHTFSAKERDTETGLSYFGSRYYSSDLSIWLSVDPMSDKYASLSPYNYCANNPVKLTDPDGRWIPGLDEDGNVTYTAEKGDSFETFYRQFDCRDANGHYKDDKGVPISTKIFNNARLNTTGQIKEGAVIKGAHVKEATNGSGVLKGNWREMNDSQKASQVMFALMYGANKRTTLPNGIYGVDLNDYINNFYSEDCGTQYRNVSIPLKGGDKIVVDMWLAPSSTIKGENGSLWVRSSVEWGNYNNAMSRYPARVYSAKNANAQYPFVAILFSVPKSKQDDFDNSLRK